MAAHDKLLGLEQDQNDKLSYSPPGGPNKVIYLKGGQSCRWEDDAEYTFPVRYMSAILRCYF